MVSKKNIQIGFEVLVISAAAAASVRVSQLPQVNDLPFWQVVGGVLLTGVLVTVFDLKSKEG